jgi:hypothetical protein
MRICISISLLVFLGTLNILPGVLSLLLLLALSSVHHVANVGHQLDLLWIEHVFVLVSIVIPRVWVSWISLSKDKHFVISSKLCRFLRIGHNILECTPVLVTLVGVILNDPLDNFRVLCSLELLIALLVRFQINLDRPIEPNWNDVPSSGQRIK